MPLPDRDGRYRWRRISSGLQPVTKGKLPAYAIHMKIVEFFDPADRQWYSVEKHGFETVWFSNLVQRDGQPNAINIENLMKLLNWDGKSFVTLHENKGDLCGQCVIETKTGDDGKARMETKWLSPWDREMGPKLGGKDDALAIQKQYGNVLTVQRAPVAPRQAPAAQRPAAPARQQQPESAMDLGNNDDGIPF